jgi:hypothetical protein
MCYLTKVTLSLWRIVVPYSSWHAEHYSGKNKGLESALIIPFMLRKSERGWSRAQKMASPFTTLNKCLFHQFSFEVYCAWNSTRAAVSYHWRLLLIWISLNTEFCAGSSRSDGSGVLNAYKKRKYFLSCWVRGCLMEGRPSCVPDIAEKSVYLNRYERDVVSSHRMSFRKYCGDTGMKVKFSNKCCWNVTLVSVKKLMKW